MLYVQIFDIKLPARTNKSLAWWTKYKKYFCFKSQKKCCCPFKWRRVTACLQSIEPLIIIIILYVSCTVNALTSSLLHTNYSYILHSTKCTKIFQHSLMNVFLHLVWLSNYSVGRSHLHLGTLYCIVPATSPSIITVAK